METSDMQDERIASLLARDPATLTEPELDELERAGHPRPSQNQLPDDPGPPPEGIDKDARAPQGQSREQLERVRERNRDLLAGAEAGPGGEREVGVGRTVSSQPSQTGGAPD